LAPHEKVRPGPAVLAFREFPRTLGGTSLSGASQVRLVLFLAPVSSRAHLCLSSGIQTT
jgi:hypothetical protein